MLDSVKAARAAKQAEHRIEGSSRGCVANPWLDFVGWHRHLAGMQVKEMVQLVWPTKDEAEFDESIHEAQESVYGEEAEAALARACQATKRMIRYAFTTSTVEHVGRATLEAVNRRETGMKDNEKPFYGQLKVQSLRKYMQVWIKMLRYIWRTADRKNVPRYRSTKAQRTQLERFRAACQKPEGECQQDARWRQEAAEKASMVFWVQMFDQELRDNEFDSGIVSALAVLGLDENGDWKAAFNYTQVLSAAVSLLVWFGLD
ncbi:hypothetical protein LTR97_001924 [Elasticomyces elasticus]|uniref:Uncharacterized protein n=1 Tax=Elasticomyces elasticus TaxID=574655 RepID=A0AAN7WID5_9PEZI|nr:hypothetical protein LTR97_001924 [Elasticomyces elasticus]